MQVHQRDVVSLVVELPLLGRHRHAAVVAHVFMPARCVVEQRGLAAVRVAHQGDGDALALVQGGAAHLLLLHDGLRRGLHRLRHLLLAHHLDEGGLAAAERHLVAHHLVFNRVVERGVEQRLHHLALHETHLHDALAESPVPRHLHDGGLPARLQFR